MAAWVGSAAPILERLRTVDCEMRGLARPLHFDDAHARPQQIDEATGLKALLEACANLEPILAVAAE